MPLDVAVPGVRRYRELQIAPAGFVETGQHAGQEGLTRGHFPVQPPVLGLERGTVGGGAESGPRVEREIDVTDQTMSVGAREGMARALVERGPGVDQRGLGVDHEPVEVENQRANHRTYKSADGTRSQATVCRSENRLP